MRQRSIVRSVTTVALAAAAAVFTSGSGVVEGGGDPPVDVIIFVSVSGSQGDSSATYAPTLTRTGGGEFTCTPGTQEGTFFVSVPYTCTIPDDSTYTVSVPTPPPPFFSQVECVLSGPADDQFTLPELDEGFGALACGVGVIAPTVFVDKLVIGEDPGPLTGADFQIELYEEAGGSLVGSTSDPDSATCLDVPDTADNCGFVELPAGDYVLGERREPGYLPLGAFCAPAGSGRGSDPDLEIREMFDPVEFPGAAFTLPGEATTDLPFFQCLVANAYAEGSIDVTMTVINDDGGTATADDWTAELYDGTSALDTSAACNPDGTCISGMFPFGQYTVGQVGPAGYTTTVNITITPGEWPEEPPIGEEPGLIVLGEIIDDPNAVFDLEPFAIVEIEIVNDDQPAPATTTTVAETTTTTVAETTTTTVAETTTTTVAETTTTADPTTTAAPTTAAPTTVVTTTAFDAGAGTLPATGADRSQNLALAALALLGFGVVAVRFARR